MMDFELSELQKMVRNSMYDFAENEVKPKIQELEDRREFPCDLVRKLGELGYMGILVPAQYGGGGMDILAYAVAQEELARVWASLGLIMSANNSLSGAPILKFGTEEQRQKYLVSLTLGKILGCYALTEPNFGSDAASIETTAKLENGTWVLNGIKQYITNAYEAQICILIARTSQKLNDIKAHKHLSAFIIKLPGAGLTVGRPIKKVGLHCSPTSEIILEDCRIPEENLLGQVGDGWKVAMYTLNGGRINIAAQAIGISRCAYEEALRYSKERKMFEGTLFDKQNTRFKLADMKIMIDAGRLLVWRACWLKDKSSDELEIANAAAEAKYFTTEAAQKITYNAQQMFGGLGYMEETIVARCARDARALTIYEGASEVQLEVIAKRL